MPTLKPPPRLPNTQQGLKNTASLFHAIPEHLLRSTQLCRIPRHHCRVRHLYRHHHGSPMDTWDAAPWAAGTAFVPAPLHGQHAGRQAALQALTALSLQLQFPSTHKDRQEGPHGNQPRPKELTTRAPKFKNRAKSRKEEATDSNRNKKTKT